jgi:hypothetical protein
MLADLLIGGFFGAIGWMTANWTVDKIMPEKTETQICSEWKEEKQTDGTVLRTRTCEPKK